MESWPESTIMSERRAASAAPDSIAVMSDHLGRLLQHADRLMYNVKQHGKNRVTFDLIGEDTVVV